MEVKEIVHEKRSLLLPLFLTLIASFTLITTAAVGCDTQTASCYSGTMGIAGFCMFGYLLKEYLLSKEQ